MKKPKSYKRLPGRHRSISGQSSLWIGSDHLLAVDRVYFEERYRRFHFSDFQAMVIQATNQFYVMSLVIAVLTLLLATPAWMFWQDNELELAAIALLPSALCLIVLVIHLVKGKTCRCYLQMRVGVHDIPAIRRRRHAEKVLDKIRPQINAAQKDIKVSMEQIPAPRRKVFKQSRSDVHGVSSYSGTWHFALYGILSVDILFTILSFFKTGMFLFVMNFILGIVLLLSTIAALIAQRNSALPASARTATWGVLALYVVAMIAGYFYFTFFLLMKQPELLVDQFAMYQYMANLEVMEHPFLMVLTLVFIVISLLCEVFGLAGIFRMRREAKAGAES